MEVLLSGYMVGFRVKTTETGKLGLIDLLQFGTAQKPATLKELVIYDSEIIDWLVKNHRYTGGIPLIVCHCDVVDLSNTRAKDKEMWVIIRLKQYKSNAVEIESKEKEQEGEHGADGNDS
jgi:hypothetical protein